ALIAEWNSLSPKERWEFGIAFGAKATLTGEDEKVLNYLMGEDGKDVWSTLATTLTRHPDRERVVKFLEERITNETSRKANYYQALGIMKVVNAESLLRQEADDFERCFTALLEAPRDKVLDYIACIESLLMITQQGSLKDKLRPLQAHSDSIVQTWVRRALGENQG